MAASRRGGLVLAAVGVVAVAVWTADLGREAPTAAATSRLRGAGGRDATSFVRAGHEDVVAATTSEAEWRPFGRVLREASRSVVRIRLEFNRRGSAWSTDHGSGFVLAGGRHVVTAAHVVDRLDNREDCEIRVALPDGRLVTAHALVRNRGDEIDDVNDWAVLALDAAVDGGLRVARPTPGAATMVLGFPSQIGRCRDGRVVVDAVGEGMDLLPVAVVGELRVGAAHHETDLDVAFGSVPLGGMSGGAVLDAEGRAVAIMTGVRCTRLNDRRARYSVLVHPVTNLRDWLRDHLPEALAD